MVALDVQRLAAAQVPEQGARQAGTYQAAHCMSLARHSMHCSSCRASQAARVHHCQEQPRLTLGPPALAGHQAPPACMYMHATVSILSMCQHAHGVPLAEQQVTTGQPPDHECKQAGDAVPSCSTVTCTHAHMHTDAIQEQRAQQKLCEATGSAEAVCAPETAREL